MNGRAYCSAVRFLKARNRLFTLKILRLIVFDSFLAGLADCESQFVDNIA